MRTRVILLVLIVLLSSAGCTSKKKCTEVTEEALFTEIDVEKIPVKINYSGPIEDIKILRDRVEVPLNYTLSDISSGVGRFYDINETTGYHFDSGSRDQNVTAYATLKIKNDDDTGGNFTVNWNYTKGKWATEAKETHFIEPQKTKTFRLEVNTTRGSDWNYSYKVVTGTKWINMPYVVYEMLNESGEKIIYRYNRTHRTVLRNVTRMVC